MGNDLEGFGVTKEELEKGKDFMPSLKLSTLEVGEAINITFLADKPRKVEYEKDGKQESFNVIKIKLNQRITKVGEVLEIDSEYELPMSSKTLTLGIARIADKYNFKLSDKKIKIKVDMTEYKDYGENRCYRVSEINEPK